jgi:ABC-type multidrug transport system permease subunit
MKPLYIVGNILSQYVRIPSWIAGTVIVPVIFTLVLGFAQQPANDAFRFVVQVDDQDAGTGAAAVIGALQRSSMLEVVTHTPAAGARVDAVIVLRPGLTDRLVREGNIDLDVQMRAGGLQRGAVINEIEQRLTPLSTAHAAGASVLSTGGSQDQAAGIAAQLLAAYDSQPPVVAEEAQAQMNGFNQSSAAAVVQWVMMGALSSAGFLVDEARRGRLRRFLLSPATEREVIFGNLLLPFLVALIQGLLIIVVGTVLGADWLLSLPAVIAVVVCYAFAMAGLTVLFGAWGVSESRVMGLGTLVALLGAMLAGAWFPRDLLPSVMLMAGKLLPSGWAMEAFGGLLTGQMGLLDVLPYCAVMLAFGAIYVTIGIGRFKTVAMR